jgi:DNA (cytosine-5)-methyltransferase 1
MKFGSVCSGIEAASVAWHPLGWTAAWLSEIEPFPCAVLKHHYPDVPNHGDMTLLPEKILSGQVEAPDLFCGGTPCQAFSVAGLRNSLDDARGNLSLTFVGIANAIDHVRSLRGDSPAIVFWENVPGVLNTKDNAFGCFLGALAGESDPITAPGERWSNAGCVFGPQRTVAWRVLDAQHFGVAQRRRRVFVVASARDDINPAEILFEFEGVRRDTPQSRKTGQEVAGTIAARFGISRNNHEECVTTPEYLGNAEGGAKEVPFLTCHNTGGTAGISNQTPLIGTYTPSSIGGYREGIGTLRANGGDVGGGSENLVTAMLDHETVGALCADSHPGAYSGQDAYTGRLIPQPISVQAYENHPSDSRVKELGDISSTVRARWGTGGGNAPMVAQPIAFPSTLSSTQCASAVNIAPSMGAKTPMAVAQPVGVDSYNLCETGDVTQTLKSPSGGVTESIGAVRVDMAVRRLTPTECERLQGFPDGYTNIPWRKAAESPDGPRYKALGNSWAVPVVAWIGQRIQNQLK